MKNDLLIFEDYNCHFGRVIFQTFNPTLEKYSLIQKTFIVSK